MKSVNMYYSDMSRLYAFVEIEKIQNSSALLIQVFTSKNDKSFIEKLLKELRGVFSKAVIIGSTTSGEIMNGEVSTNKTVLSFTLFEHTTLRSHIVTYQEDEFFSGKALAEALIGEDSKLMIVFADGLNTNGDALLDGIHAVDSKIIVAGGLAGDNGTFVRTYVFTEKGIVLKGAVAVVFDSKILKVYNDYSFNWHRLGKELRITKVKNNRVYTIDNRTAVDTYIHYLGKEMAEDLPAIGIEFPLISVRDGVMVARAVLSKHKDGSLSFAGNLKVGDKVQFGYGDPIEILKYSSNILSRIKGKPSEAIFIYSCMARRHFMPDLIDVETLPLQQISPTVGFFTYGEFYTSNSKEVLNQSMTIISLSESDDAIQHNVDLPQSKAKTTTSTNALIHLVNRTTEEMVQQEVLRETQNTFEMLFEKSPDGIVLIENNRFIECNQKILDIFGYVSKESFLKTSPLKIFPRRQNDGSYSYIKLKKIRETVLNRGNDAVELVLKKQNKETFWADIILTKTSLQGRDIIYVVCRDITQRKEMEFELANQKDIFYYQAHHDALTGLPNRVFSMKELKTSLEEATRKNKALTLMFLDLDRFKRINDSLGHDVGDKVLHTVGERIRKSIRKEDMVARLGGDEFLIIIKGISRYESIVGEAKRILQLVDEPISVEHHTLYSSASIGISCYPVDAINADDLLKYADTAMYKAKEEGGNTFQFYSPEMTDKAHEHVMMERDLREGLKNDSFEVYYQPQINIEREEVIGVEALVRWNHPTVGLLTPGVFLGVAKKTGLIVALDLWVMRKAMREVSTWHKEGLKPGVLALNISMKQLEYPRLKEEIEESLLVCDFKAQWLELELTETEMMKNPDKVISILEALHDMGISIAIDDFGTGYSPLSHLKRLPIDKLKIDKSFIADIPKNKDAVAIVNTMIILAQNMHLSLLAEGVETKAQRDFLLAQGCLNVQGYYYSKPLDTLEMKNHLHQKSNFELKTRNDLCRTLTL